MNLRSRLQWYRANLRLSRQRRRLHRKINRHLTLNRWQYRQWSLRRLLRDLERLPMQDLALLLDHLALRLRRRQYLRTREILRSRLSKGS